MYKILRFHPNRELSLEGPVFTDDDDRRWETADEALDELSAEGWEIHLPVYGPAGDERVAVARLEGFILMNQFASPADDIGRRVQEAETKLAEDRRALARTQETSPSHDDLRIAILRTEAKLRNLRERLHRVQSAKRRARGTPLPYGKFRGPRMSTETDFKLAEWRSSGDAEHGG